MLTEALQDKLQDSQVARQVAKLVQKLHSSAFATRNARSLVALGGSRRCGIVASALGFQSEGRLFREVSTFCVIFLENKLCSTLSLDGSPQMMSPILKTTLHSQIGDLGKLFIGQTVSCR